MSAHMQWYGKDPVRVRAHECAGTLAAELSNGADTFTFVASRTELVDLISALTVAVTSHPPVPSDPCEYGWGCTDIACPTHKAELATGGVIAKEDAPMIGERLAVMAADPGSCITRVTVVPNRWTRPDDAA